MLLVSDFLNAIVQDMIADSNWLAHETTGVSDVGLIPVVAPFTPAETLALGSLSFPPSSFFNARTILCGDSLAEAVVNAQGRMGIKLTEPLGGFTWVVDDDTLGPQTVYGFALVRAASGVPTVLYGAAVLPVPQVFTMHGQTIQATSIIGYFLAPVFQAATEAFSTGTDEMAP